MINVTKTYLPNLDKYKNYVEKIFESGWLTNNGQFVKLLQERLEAYLGVEHVILVSNGTLALQVAYKALELTGDVITTPFSFVATTSTLIWENLNPIFVDIDKETFNIDSNKIESSITEKTSAIVPVHVFGNPCDVEKISEVATKNNLKVIYDASHAFNIKYKNDSILNYGDISTLSFHSTKIFHTIEGGAIIVKNHKLYEKIKLMINFGISGPDKVECLGINCKMNEFQAAMGLCILDDMDSILKSREEVSNYYKNNLSKKLKMQKHKDYVTQNYSYFPVVFESEKILIKIKEQLNKNDIFPRRYFYPSLDTLPYINNDKCLPISFDLANRILCLPIYESMYHDELDKIVKIINSSL